MSHFNGAYPLHPGHPDATSVYPQHPVSMHHDEHGSQSGSDDGGAYGAYVDPQRGEVELDDDSNSLTSQTLNTDGTPKRPMNAFMIFARRRRPQVSAENQSMRTGEISKILSKEWNSMGTAEKQFYLEQAKILKDNFNNKYPDYVYRRRPNNTRKKRRPDAGNHLVDPTAASDQGDEQPPGGDYGEPSPVDNEVTSCYSADPSHLRVSTHSSTPFNEASGFSSPVETPNPSYMYSPSEESFSLNDTRSSYDVSQRRSSQDPIPSNTSMNINRLPSSLPYYTSTYHPQPYPYMSEQPSHTNAAWDTGPSGRTNSNNWSGGGMERPISSHPGSKLHTYPPTNAQVGWPPHSPSASPGDMPHQNAQNLLPTLSSPFFPAAQPQGNYAGTTSSGSPHSSSPSPYNTTAAAGGGNTTHMTHASATMPNIRPDSGYGNRSYTGSSNMHGSSMGSYSSISPQDNHPYQRTMHRGHPSLPQLANSHSLSHHQPYQPSSPATSRAPFWPRES
ncbi:hypothetical protein EYR40_002020 [Pleurotus pulmonarius]|nr:hypothetical protein EYR40_002020 [Pleurotus pulmonarius]